MSNVTIQFSNVPNPIGEPFIQQSTVSKIVQVSLLSSAVILGTMNNPTLHIKDKVKHNSYKSSIDFSPTYNDVKNKTFDLYDMELPKNYIYKEFNFNSYSSVSVKMEEKTMLDKMITGRSTLEKFSSISATALSVLILIPSALNLLEWSVTVPPALLLLSIPTAMFVRKKLREAEHGS